MFRGLKFINLALVPLLIALVALVGCRRKPATPTAEPPSEVSSTPSTQSSSAQQSKADPAGSPKVAAFDRLPTAPNDSSLRLPVHQELTGAIHLYVTDSHKLPPDFETLVKGRYIKAMPSPPTGKHFALDRSRMQVVITD